MVDHSKKKSSERLFFVDHLRVALTILVVLHHIAVIYAANIGFYYLEPAYHDVLSLYVLVIFQLINQSYFMGFFFLISGYFTPAAFNRKGAETFMKDRLLRLGIPTLVFAFILSPILYPKLIGVGPLWFAVMLLVFDLVYVLAKSSELVDKQARETKSSASYTKLPTYRMIGIFILVLALVSYLIRTFLPLGKSVLGFPSLAYLPQYLSFFVIGMIAFHRDWFRTIPSSMGKVGFGMAVAATLILFPLALSGHSAFLGGGHWQSGIYALWDSIFSIGMCLGLIIFFRRFFDQQGRLGRFLSQHAFTVYIIHIPVIVFLARALHGVHLEQLLKFGLVAIIGVPLSFAVAYLVRKIPFATRIL
ncbi:glucans biosynthesis protein C [Peptococcaceae bacterium CEB3]|nr:glucans biosynthesis protein C [Peptococcaceae bacterium CEB3]